MRSVFFRIGVFFIALIAAPLALAGVLPDISGNAHQTAIEHLYRLGVIGGYPDGTFQPERVTNRAELLKILVVAVGGQPDADTHHDCFPDVANEWFAPYVCYAKDQGWVQGYPHGTFQPGMPVNLAEALKMIINADGRLAQSKAVMHAGVPAGAWYAPYLNAALEANIISQAAMANLPGPMSRGGLSDMLFRLLAQRGRGIAAASSLFSSASAAQPDGTARNFSSPASPGFKRRGGGGPGAATATQEGGTSSSSLTTPSIIFGDITKTYGDANFTLVPTSNSAGAFTFASSDTSVAVITGDRVLIAGAGTAVITATQAANGEYAARSVTATLSVSAVAPTIIFNDITKTYGDASFTLSPTSNSAGSFSYVSSNTGVATVAGSTVTIVAAGTVTITATQASAGNYLSGSAATTLTVSTLTPSITFNAITKTYGDANFTPSPTSNSAGTFTFESGNAAVATVSGGNSIVITGAGSATITVTQAANGNYGIGSTTATLTVNTATPSITFNDIAKNYGDANFTLSPTSNSAGSFSYVSSNTGVATVSGNTVTIVAVGTTTIVATQAATSNFAERTVNATLTVSAIAPTLGTFGSITKNYGDANFSLTAPTSNSAGTFTYASSNTSVATVSSNTVTIVGAGSTTITATQAAAGNYTSATATTTLTVNAIAPTLGGFGNITKQMGDIPFTLTAPTSNSAGAFTYASSNTGVATVSSNTVTLVSNGTTTITATQAANGNYTSGTKTLTLTVVVGECFTAPCLNGGTCENGPGGTFTCTCDEGYSGSICELDTANCAPGSGFECLNGGTCTPTAAHGECTCAICFFGSRCDQYDSITCE